MSIELTVSSTGETLEQCKNDIVFRCGGALPQTPQDFNKIRAIKFIRNELNFSLKDAKVFIERMLEQQ